MNPAAILSLISDLYGQVTALQQENAALRAELATCASTAEQMPTGEGAAASAQGVAGGA